MEKSTFSEPSPEKLQPIPAIGLAASHRLLYLGRGDFPQVGVELRRD